VEIHRDFIDRVVFQQRETPFSIARRGFLHTFEEWQCYITCIIIVVCFYFAHQKDWHYEQSL